MKRRGAAVLFLCGLVGLAVGCGSGGTPATVAPGASTAAPTSASVPTSEPGGGPVAGEDVCVAMTEPLVMAALGQAADEPQFGDIAGADGVYCFFPAAADAATGVEVQLSEMTEDDFNALAEQLGATEPLAGVGQAAFSLDRAYTGTDGASVVAWDNGQTAVVLIERSGAEQAALSTAATALAAKVLADL